MDSTSKLSTATIALHWIVALGMISLIASGIYMHETEAFSIYPLHKSFGVLITLFVLWRIYLRIKNGWPTPVRQYKPLEIRLSKIVHWLLIIGTILMPVSGMMMSGLGGHGIPFFGLELLARNPSPENPKEVIAYSESLAFAGKVMHGLGGNILIAAITLHLLGALKHHFIDKDATLLRMLGKSK
ncbi:MULTISPECIES: cytochrome b [Thiomicrorhabdus]|uniref:Cytochrome b n=1 Tax=Thiomicrorhabdus heinhorstiae TaxID=2748010 RepID=A0ABS0BV86_9GAMM|nr:MULTISPECIES: cytochrome b [Thiomicrorhabdus]MBF6057742.1 cytochrome b [Thiomicrorhabdus heinhorstiae]